MNTSKTSRFLAVLALALLAGAALWAVLTLAAPGDAPPSQGGAPSIVAYQGEVRVGGAPHNGAGYFKFAVVNAAGTTTYWSNDGSSSGGSEPALAVQLQVDQGLFSVLLGDTGMQPLAAAVFAGPERTLRVWFSADNSTFSRLLPDTRIAAVPYALQAQSAAAAPWGGISGMPAGFADGTDDTGVGYAQVVIVAKAGGDFDRVQAAIDSIGDAAAGKPYLVKVAPGVYSETVTMKPHVHLQGAGQGVTTITSTVSTSSDSPTQATLVLTDHVSLRDLTVGNSGAGEANVAVLAGENMTDVRVARVTAYAVGNSAQNHAICLIGDLLTEGGDTQVVLREVTALAENGSSNYGLSNRLRASAVLQGGSFTARGGDAAYGIHNLDAAMLKADGVTVIAQNGDSNYGLYNGASRASLHSSDITARGGSYTYGIVNGSSDLSIGLVDAQSVVILAENGSVGNYGLTNAWLSTVVLRCGSLTARGGTWTYGIYNDTDCTLKIHSATILAEKGSDSNYGLFNGDNSEARIDHAQLTGASRALMQTSGAVYLGSTQLDGNATRTGGTLTCYGVYRGNYAAYTCP